MSYEWRINKLEAELGALASAPLHDREIFEVMAGVREGTIEATAREVAGLYDAIEEPMMASVLAGAMTLRQQMYVVEGRVRLRQVELEFEDGRQVVEPPRLAPIDQLAQVTAFDFNLEIPAEFMRLPPWLNRAGKYHGSPFDDAWLESPCDSIGSVREALAQALHERRDTSFLRPASRGYSFEKAPTLSEEESSRLMKLIEPLQLAPDPDLPLLLWNDDSGSIRHSWLPSSNGGVPVDPKDPSRRWLLANLVNGEKKPPNEAAYTYLMV